MEVGNVKSGTPIDPLKLDQCITTAESSSENEFW
jgi:hypothetical protein